MALLLKITKAYDGVLWFAKDAFKTLPHSLLCLLSHKEASQSQFTKQSLFVERHEFQVNIVFLLNVCLEFLKIQGSAIVKTQRSSRLHDCLAIYHILLFVLYDVPVFLLLGLFSPLVLCVAKGCLVAITAIYKVSFVRVNTYYCSRKWS